MVHYVRKLTALKVLKVKAPGLYADGAGLYLQVTGDGKTRIAKSWVYRFQMRGRVREMGAVRYPCSGWPRRAPRRPSAGG